VRAALWMAVALASASPAVARAQLRDVTAAEVRDALTRGTAVVVDARTADEYAQAHIPGAISIPAERVDAEASRLPHDKARPLIFYCRGPG
jgi:rhodanese-related sulfurtransferase